MNPLPTTMRAVLLTGHGGYDKLALRDDVPRPVAGPGEVIVRVAAAGINNTDINTRIGWYAKSVTEATEAAAAAESQADDDTSWAGGSFTFPRIQGADACGRIVEVGPGVATARLGERVLVEPVFRGPAAFDIRYFGSEVDGGFANYACVPSAHAHKIDTSLSDVDLASVPCAYSAAENMLTRLDLAKGERVLITGASGGVGSAAVQLAKRRGAEVFAIAGENKTSAVRSLGADHVIPRQASLKTLFGSNYFDAAVDVVGGRTFAALLDTLKPNGRYAVAGAIAGPLVELDLRTLYLKDLQLLGCTVLEPEVFPNLVRYLEQGEIKPHVAATYPLEEIVTAQQAFLDKRHVGKIVLTLTD